MQTVSWQTVLDRIIDIQDTNPNASDIRMTELDVASRIMRKENYLIALFNKDILNITIPLPYLRNKHIFTKDLEWNLAFCMLGFIFDNRGQVRKRFLKEKNKHLLVAGLKRRFIFMGLLNFALSPFIFAYLLLHFFFRYFEVNIVNVWDRWLDSLAKNYDRSITKTLERLDPESIPLTPSGSFVNSMNYLICLKIVLAKVMNLPTFTSTSFQKKKRSWWQGKKW